MPKTGNLKNAIWYNANDMRTTYEWIAETMDGEDAVDVRGADTLADLAPEPHEHVGLCKSIGDEDEGVIHRTWAYLQSGKLPETFEDGSAIPKRFRKEL